MRASRADYESFITLSGDHPNIWNASVGGTVFHDGKPRILMIKGIKVDAEFTPSMIYVTNEDKPGFIGRFTSLLGEAHIQHRHLRARPRPGRRLGDRARLDRRQGAGRGDREGWGTRRCVSAPKLCNFDCRSSACRGNVEYDHVQKPSLRYDAVHAGGSSRRGGPRPTRRRPTQPKARQCRVLGKSTKPASNGATVASPAGATSTQRRTVQLQASLASRRKRAARSRARNCSGAANSVAGDRSRAIGC